MDGQGNAANQLPYGSYVGDAYPLNQVAPASVVGVQPSQFTGNHQLSYQQIQQQQNRDLEQQLQTFWATQYRDIENLCDFRNQSLPLARIKKIMKSDEDVRMISAEAPVIFARACEMFILELTLRSWNQTEENRRRTLQRNDISTAIARTDLFDFLIDIVPRDEDVLAGIPRGTVPITAPIDAIPYYPIEAANQYPPHVRSSHGMMMWPQNAYAHPAPAQPYMPAGPAMWPQTPQPGQPSSSGN